MNRHLCVTIALLATTHNINAHGQSPPQNTPTTPVRTANEPTILGVEQAARQAATVYERVSPAVVRVEGHGGKGGGSMGVIITAEGDLLLSDGQSGQRINATLSDGRIAEGRVLGWSREWGIALGKLDEKGPWPHAPIVENVPVRAGQPLVTLVYPLNEDEAGKKPLLDLEWVDRSAEGFWFARPNGTRYEWQERGGLAFDLEGRLLGTENTTMLNHGTIYTHVNRVQELWSDLVDGKNIDQDRLTDRAEAANAQPANPRPTEVSKEAVEKAVAASVRVRYRPGAAAYVTGTIITQEGLVATCAHHFALPGDKVVIGLPDGRDVAAEVVGLSFPADIGLIRITERGLYPHAEVGDSTRLQPGDPCLIVGYGPVDRQARRPNARPTSVVPTREGYWSFLLSTDQAAATVGGDSGGGLFDAQGRLVAFSPAGLSYPDWPNQHARVELLRVQQAALHCPFERASVSELGPVDATLEAAAESVRPWVVEVMDGDRPAALGTVVGADGRILTKLSALPSAPACRLSDGRVVTAEVRRSVREHDLAVLKIEAQDLPVVRWSDADKLPIGLSVALAGPTWERGTIGHSVVGFPGESGRVGATLRDTDQGLEVAELTSEDFLPEDAVYGFGPLPLQKGDILRSLEGRPITTLAEFREMCDGKNDPVAVAGDRVRLVVEREGKPVELSMLLRCDDLFPLAGQTARRSGFAQAYGVMAAPKLFGGAVVDADGNAVGVAIAARQKGWTLMIPAAVARTLDLE